MQGTVKFWNEDKGYGFIRPTDGSADVFVHATGVESGHAGGRELMKDELVEFEIGEGRKGPNAINVRVL